MTAATSPPRRAAVAFVLVTLGIDAFGIGVVLPVLPELVRRVSHHSIANASLWVGLLVCAYALTQFIAAPILGGLSDRFGRRPVILLSVSGICGNYILLALAPTLGWILFGRLLAGATAANTSASMAYIADITPPEHRAQRFGLISATFGLGFVMGPAIGGLVGSYALRGPFILSAVLAGLNALYGVFVLPESLAPALRRPFSWRRANPIGAFRILAADGFLARLAAAWSGVWFGISTMQTVFVLYTTLRFHWSPIENGLAFAFFGICQVIVQVLLVKRVVTRIGEPRTAMLGCALNAVAFALFATVPRAWMMFPALLIQAGGSLAQAAIRAMLSRRASPSRQGEVQGSFASVESLTQMAAPLICGTLFGLFAAPAGTAGFAAGIHFPGAPLLLAAILYMLSLLWVRHARAYGILHPTPAAFAPTPAPAAPVIQLSARS